jgi:phosphatidylinositol alpha-1,6-mannosyltransferase
MTVHGPRPWWQRALFRDWSDPVLTVSEADRDNITGLFGVAERNVVVGFLGVDVSSFRPGIPAEDLRREWDVGVDSPLVVNVSRFSHRKARPAISLVEALPWVRRRLPDAGLVLVGGGPELERIRRAVERLDGAPSHPPARAVGPRTDIPRVLNAANVAVATATVALESLACATPTIAYGRTGYFGPVTPENFERARALCFADHGRGLPSTVQPERLADDIISLLSDREAARRRAEEIRSIIAERYSVERMVDLVESLYERLLVGRGATAS